MFTTHEAKILDGTPNYFVIEDIGHVCNVQHFQRILYELKDYVKEKGIQSVSIVLNEKEALYTEYPDVLKAFGYQKREVQYFYKRDLTILPEQKESIEIKSLEQTSSGVFKKIWKEARIGSLNDSGDSSSLSVEMEFEGMKSELGPEYLKSCLIAFHGQNPIGITMPQIEPGTISEGRLFYFGIVPAHRNKGWGIALHKLSLHLLQKMGATYYIGATGYQNIPMQRIFQVNGCQKMDRRYTYRLKEHGK